MEGGHKPPGLEQVPADLRVDHVYLVSCKYGSSILHNVAPHLTDRASERRRGSYQLVRRHRAEAYQELYGAL
jgi:hypothetical protein